MDGMMRGPFDMPMMHHSDRYDFVRDIGSDNYGVARLMGDKFTKELVAVKYIDRGYKVILTPTHLAIVMEYAAGGEIFERISTCNGGRFNEDEARYFFQQLISGVSYSHDMQVCHRDLKSENTLLDGSPAARLKICYFGYSKSPPTFTVGTLGYVAPEVLHWREFDGKIADVWSCGVTLYVMLVVGYPFEDPVEPKDLRKMTLRILGVQYTIPENISLSEECRDLISRIFVQDPEKRIMIPEIKRHNWFQRNLPGDLTDQNASSNQFQEPEQPMQSVDTIMQIISEANGSLNDFTDSEIDIDSSEEIVYAM